MSSANCRVEVIVAIDESGTVRCMSGYTSYVSYLNGKNAFLSSLRSDPTTLWSVKVIEVDISLPVDFESIVDE